jgi:hypothetical protein
MYKIFMHVLKNIKNYGINPFYNKKYEALIYTQITILITNTLLYLPFAIYFKLYLKYPAFISTKVEKA